jgi:hypothetical protein
VVPDRGHPTTKIGLSLTYGTSGTSADLLLCSPARVQLNSVLTKEPQRFIKLHSESKASSAGIALGDGAVAG